MTKPEDALLEYWKQHREQLRQTETQRSVLSNFVLVIVAGIGGLIVQQHFVLRTLPLSFLPGFEATAAPIADGIDIKGPYIQGRPGARFIYLSWAQ